MVWGEHEWPSNHYYYGDWTPWEGWQSVCSSVFRLELKPGDDKKRFWIYTPSKSFDEVLGVDSGNSLLRWTKAADDPAQLFYWDEDREIGPQERENLKRYITWPNPPRA
jgi:hypothetical protein